MFKPNYELVKSWAFKYWDRFWLIAFVLIFFDGFMTILSTEYIKYAHELNPLVNFFTPFGAFLINSVILLYMRYGKTQKTYRQYTFFTLCFLIVFYGYACVNHFYILIFS